jgi:hypothetical protein
VLINCYIRFGKDKIIQKLHAYLVLTFLQGRYNKKVLTYYVVGYAKDGSSVPRVSILYMDI